MLPTSATLPIWLFDYTPWCQFFAGNMAIHNLEGLDVQLNLELLWTWGNQHQT